MSLLSVGKNFTRMFDQYSVICVFGSVVGCVVVPLITQSMESLIFSAIVISLTAKTLQSRMLAASRDPPVQEDRRRSKDKDYQHDRKQKRSSKKVAQVQPLVNIEVVRRHREEDLKKQEEHRKMEKERRVGEKRDKKARKKEVRLKRKEEERKEKEKEEQHRRERQETRLMRKQQEREMKERDRVYPFHYGSLENIESIICQQKPIRRERKHSSSSSTSTSSSSTHSPTTSIPRRIQQQYSHPVRASSDPQLVPTTPSSHLYSPQPPPRAWQSLPRTTSQWQTKNDLPTVPKVDPNSRGQSPSHYYLPSHLCWPPHGLTGTNQATVYPTIHPQVVKSPSFGELDPQGWAPTTHPNMTSCAVTPCFTTAGALFSSGTNSVGNDGCYSLFSEQQSPFGVSLLSPPGSSERCSSADVMSTSGSSTSENSPLTATKQGFDEWPVL